MNYFKTIYAVLSVLTMVQLQSCSAESETLLAEEALTVEDASITNLSAKKLNLASHGTRATKDRSKGQSDNISSFKSFKARDIATLNPNRIAKCNKSTNTNTYFRGSTVDQKNRVGFYYSVMPKNKKRATIVISMCKRGKKIVPVTFALNAFLAPR